MAGSDGQSIPEKGLWQWAQVTEVISATQFRAKRLHDFGEYSDTFFVGWGVYVLRRGDGVAAPPQNEMQTATAFVQATGQVTCPAFTAPLTVGDEILMLHPDIATAVLNIAAILAAVGPTGPSQGLCYYGVVTATAPGNQFTIPTLAGLGANKFIDTSLVNQYQAFVFRDASGPGAAPQGELRPITNYATGTGSFITTAFSAAVAVGDEILIIHPLLARIMNLYGYPPATGNLAANWNTGVATSGLAGGDVVTIGAANVKNKVHSLLVDIANLTAGATITIRLYQLVNGVEREVYQQTFVQGTDPDGLWIINGTLAIHEALRVELFSNNVLDDGAVVAYDYMMEAM